MEVLHNSDSEEEEKEKEKEKEEKREEERKHESLSATPIMTPNITPVSSPKKQQLERNEQPLTRTVELSRGVQRKIKERARTLFKKYEPPVGSNRSSSSSLSDDLPGASREEVHDPSFFRRLESMRGPRFRKLEIDSKKPEPFWVGLVGCDHRVPLALLQVDNVDVALPVPNAELCDLLWSRDESDAATPDPLGVPRVSDDASVARSRNIWESSFHLSGESNDRESKAIEYFRKKLKEGRLISREEKDAIQYTFGQGKQTTQKIIHPHEVPDSLLHQLVQDKTARVENHPVLLSLTVDRDYIKYYRYLDNASKLFRVHLPGLHVSSQLIDELLKIVNVSIPTHLVSNELAEITEMMSKSMVEGDDVRRGSLDVVSLRQRRQQKQLYLANLLRLSKDYSTQHTVKLALGLMQLEMYHSAAVDEITQVEFHLSALRKFFHRLETNEPLMKSLTLFVAVTIKRTAWLLRKAIDMCRLYLHTVSVHIPGYIKKFVRSQEVIANELNHDPHSCFVISHIHEKVFSDTARAIEKIETRFHEPMMNLLSEARECLLPVKDHELLAKIAPKIESNFLVVLNKS